MIELLIVNSLLCLGIRAAVNDGILSFMPVIFEQDATVFNEWCWKTNKKVKAFLHPLFYGFFAPLMLITMIIAYLLIRVLNFLSTPSYRCLKCMASVWGLTFVYMMDHLFFFNFLSVYTCAWVLALAGFNAAVEKIIVLMNASIYLKQEKLGQL